MVVVHAGVLLTSFTLFYKYSQLNNSWRTTLPSIILVTGQLEQWGIRKNRSLEPSGSSASEKWHFIRIFSVQNVLKRAVNAAWASSWWCSLTLVFTPISTSKLDPLIPVSSGPLGGSSLISHSWTETGFLVKGQVLAVGSVLHTAVYLNSSGLPQGSMLGILLLLGPKYLTPIFSVCRWFADPSASLKEALLHLRWSSGRSTLTPEQKHLSELDPAGAASLSRWELPGTGPI